jgi:hypothetical protein
VVAAPLATWLLGTDPHTRGLRPWSVLLAPAGSAGATVAAAATVAAGVGLYLARGRPWADVRGPALLQAHRHDRRLTSGWWPTARPPRRP